MIWLAAVWFVFFTMFLALGCFQWRMVGKGMISHLRMPERQQRANIRATITIAGSDIDDPLRNFVSEVNGFIEDYNQTSNKEHKTQAIGYWVASATAILSLALTTIS